MLTLHDNPRSLRAQRVCFLLARLGLWYAAAFAALALSLAVPAAAGTSPKKALVTWRVADETFRTYLRRPADVARVRRAIRAHAAAGIPIGRVARRARENRGHAWHLVNVTLAEVTIELCDGRPSDLDRDLGYWLGTVRRYCPWSALPVRLRWVP